MSFSNPQVFKEVQELQGQTVEVEVGKNEAGFTEWRSIKRSEGPAAANTGGSTGASAAGNTRVVGSNYATKEERAAIQVYIVRQSSLSAAVASLTPGAKAPLDPKQIIEVARQFADFVFEQEETVIGE